MEFQNFFKSDLILFQWFPINEVFEISYAGRKQNVCKYRLRELREV